jgi:hypothetical protein
MLSNALAGNVLTTVGELSGMASPVTCYQFVYPLRVPIQRNLLYSHH